MWWERWTHRRNWCYCSFWVMEVNVIEQVESAATAVRQYAWCVVPTVGPAKCSPRRPQGPPGVAGSATQQTTFLWSLRSRYQGRIPRTLRLMIKYKKKPTYWKLYVAKKQAQPNQQPPYLSVSEFLIIQRLKSDVTDRRRMKTHQFSASTSVILFDA